MNDFKSYCDLYFPKPVAAVEEEEDHNMDDDDDDDYDPDAKKKKKTKKKKKKAATGPVNFVYERINERWEICIGMSPDQQSQQGTRRFVFVGVMLRRSNLGFVFMFLLVLFCCSSVVFVLVCSCVFFVCSLFVLCLLFVVSVVPVVRLPFPLP